MFSPSCALLSATLFVQVPDTVRLDPVVVTATRSPRPLRSTGSSADVITDRELRRRQLSTLREALELAPGGVVLLNGGPGGVASLFLRGVSSTQTLLLMDGIRVNDANTSPAGVIGAAELGGAGTVEIVRGPQSTLYGGAAIGGVVAVAAAPGEGPARGSVLAEGGSFESWKGRVSAGGGIGAFRLNTSFSANGTDNERRPNDWRQRNQLVRIDYTGGRFAAGATYRGLQQHYTSPGDLRSSNTTPEGTTTFDNQLATIWLETSPLPRWSSRLTLGGQEQFTRGTGRFNGGDEFVFRLSNSRRVLDWQNRLVASGRLTAVAGVNREWSTVSSDGEPLDERLLGIYGEVVASPLAPLSMTAGVRSDNYNTFEDAVTWRVTAAWRFERSGTRVRAAAGTGFMPPSLAARFGSAFQEPNPSIRPERSRGIDVGIDQDIAGGRAQLSLTWFRNSLADLIGFESAVFPALGRSINIERARTRGLEAGGRVRLAHVEARIAYTLLDAVSLTETDASLRKLIRRPRHTLSGDLSISPGDRVQAGVGLVVVADREDTDFNAFPSVRVDPGDYALLRLHGAFDVARRITLRGRIENLLDARYEPVYGFPGLGRSGTLALEIGF